MLKRLDRGMRSLVGRSPLRTLASNEDDSSLVPAPPPRRITGRRGGLSVNTQLRLVKQLQSAEQTVRPVVRPRKVRELDVPSLDHLQRQAVERDARERELARSRAARDQLEAAAARARRAKRSTVYLVDGYNVIHAWPHLKKLLLADNLEAARETLISELNGFSVFRSLKVVIVFDSQTEECRVREVQRESVNAHLDVVYACSGDLGSADSFIEAEVISLMRAKEPPSIYVCTNDRASSEASFCSGALRLQSQALLDEKLKTDTELAEVLRTKSAQNAASSRRLGIAGAAGVSSKLAALREKLQQQARKDGAERRRVDARRTAGSQRVL